MRKIVLTAMLAALWMGYNEKHRPIVEPEIIEVAETQPKHRTDRREY